MRTGTSVRPVQVRGSRLLVAWLAGLALGIAGTGRIFDVVTRGVWAGLPLGLGLFLVGLWLSGTVVARSRKSLAVPHQPVAVGILRPRRALNR
ncbi:MAG: hypothetical protein ACYDH5_05620 [Acidimicrobiales bacterium]